MQTCSRAPMIGRRMGWGDHDRSDHRHTKLAEREQVAIDIADELAVEDIIARSAITPDAYSTITGDDEFEGWLYWAEPDPSDYFDSLMGDEYDPFEDDDPLTYDDIDFEGPPIEGREPLDTDDLPGWGTRLDFEDLAGLTITNRPYGFSGYGQRDR